MLLDNVQKHADLGPFLVHEPPQDRIRVPRESDRELTRPQGVQKVVVPHVLSLGHGRQLGNVLLVVVLLNGAKLFHEVLGFGVVRVVDELEVHVEEHGIEHRV